MISGLFVFVPALSTVFGAGFTQFMRISHRVVGAIFIITPLISAIAAPAGVGRLGKKYFTKWTPEDFEFLKKFVPYMLGQGRIALQIHDGGGIKVLWRNIRVKTL